jgi:hypothetical protein
MSHYCCIQETDLETHIGKRVILINDINEQKTVVPVQLRGQDRDTITYSNVLEDENTWMATVRKDYFYQIARLSFYTTVTPFGLVVSVPLILNNSSSSSSSSSSMNRVLTQRELVSLISMFAYGEKDIPFRKRIS